MPFIAPERLLECLHIFDTQLNEALHNVVLAKYTPKHRSYATTMSLHNRISIVIGVHNLGHRNYWTKVFHRLKLEMNGDLVDNLSQQDGTKNRKCKYNARKEVKSKIAKVQNEKKKVMMQKQKRDEIRGLTYGSGVAL